MIGVTASVASEFVIDLFKAKLVPMLHGSPGTGKSAIVKEVADKFNLQLIDLRLSQCDPTDLMGFPKVNKDGRADYAPMVTFPLQGDSLPKGKDGWLLFLDEFNSAPTSVQATAYKLLFDRMIGLKHLHKNVAIACAGNLDTDGAIVNKLSTANQSRLCHIELTVSTKDWIEWAQTAGIDYRITSYIQCRPGSLHAFNADHSDMTFACPRTWEFASQLLSVWGNNHDITAMQTILLCGVLSEGIAREFVNFLKIFKELPDVKVITSDPLNAPLSNDPSTLYAMGGVLGDNVNNSNATSFMRYIDRMPKEFQIITIKELSRRFPEIEFNQLFLDKVTEVATMI